MYPTNSQKNENKITPKSKEENKNKYKHILIITQSINQIEKEEMNGKDEEKNCKTKNKSTQNKEKRNSNTSERR
jgi:hypothetical protein